MLTTLSKTCIMLKMWNYETLKIQRMFQNCFKMLELQESFTTYKWVIMYMKTYILEYNKTKECENSIFGDD
jgi:hypothetical protein